MHQKSPIQLLALLDNASCTDFADKEDCATLHHFEVFDETLPVRVPAGGGILRVEGLGLYGFEHLPRAFLVKLKVRLALAMTVFDVLLQGELMIDAEVCVMVQVVRGVA